jgi:hypothetical protein
MNVGVGMSADVAHAGRVALEGVAVLRALTLLVLHDPEQVGRVDRRHHTAP